MRRTIRILLLLILVFAKTAPANWKPQLIEMQGFPTLFAFQAFHSELTAEYANMPANFSPYLNGYNKETYLQLLKDIIVGDLDPKMLSYWKYILNNKKQE